MNWISVKDRLPEVGMQKPHDLRWLVTDGKSIRIESVHPSYWNNSRWDYYFPVTHWMPLPEAVKEDRNV